MGSRAVLRSLFQAALNSAAPEHCLASYLPTDTHRPAVVIGAGKAAASMAKALEDHWQGPLSGLVITRYGHGEPCEHIQVLEAAHPVPDAEGERAAKDILARVSDLSADDLVICLLSGGGSSLLSLPAEGISLGDKQRINQALLSSGASISEINTVRKHLSAIKGGRLAQACYPAQLITLAISDVPGDKVDLIASGPTVGDSSSGEEARAILKRYSIDMPAAVDAHLRSAAALTIPPDHPCFSKSTVGLIATPWQALQAAAEASRAMGIPALILGDQIEGEAKDVAIMHGAIARAIKSHGEPIRPPCVILSGGETTVTVKGSGRGGRNAEFLLSLANYLKGEPGIYALAADTDGIDGSEDNAGAWLTPDTWQRGIEAGLEAGAMLHNNDGYSYFQRLGDLLLTGPTRTNVNDFRAILVLAD